MCGGGGEVKLSDTEIVLDTVNSTLPANDDRDDDHFDGDHDEGGVDLGDDDGDPIYWKLVLSLCQLGQLVPS